MEKLKKWKSGRSKFKVVPSTNRSLQELEPHVMLVEGDSYLLSELSRLSRVPLRQLQLEDMRLLIEHGAGLRFVVPIAIAHLEDHPLAAGDFYPGDLLKAVMDVGEGFWSHHTELRSRLVNALERALERVKKVRTPDGLEAEFRAGLRRHREMSK